MKRAFSSDMYRNVYKEAVRQGWVPQHKGRSPHAYLLCPHPGCHYRQAFSTTGRSHKCEFQNHIAGMRKHGFVWQGRGGEHTAEPLQTPKKVDRAS